MVGLYLVQHGKAFDEKVDPERRLTPEGVAETERIAKYLNSIGIIVAEIIHSGKARARQTAEIFAKYLGVDNVREVDGLNPNDDPRIWFERLLRLDHDLMIVGHLPHLSRLVSLLIIGNPDIKIVEFRYSGVLRLSKAEGNWVINWFITPDVIR
ncbi:phosphohistidine phosphatase SixA [Vulcanisaeta sp. JCM 16161]|uniref:phosphohistidine phosphatase SixA n=1 Tax=Vulcanisaeta sp. JCM 16161 TaxID=1295372 RepID=UPI0006D05642|nr:phosphohistidine phosphatase SixA [Vulcanisaeta sp. JCM 16161]